ncbi:hypothetical protein cypCar_00000316 [Cyprinus carpio]|nr:hypothetical protein cypCar_00000316 [Cyprinus carpio]
MSKEGERQSVLRTTKVRTALKGDNSWIQRREQENLEKDEEEKPWVAEVRANRSNGVFEETSPVSSPTANVPQPISDTEKPKTPASGYLIRGVFKKTDSKPTSTSNSSTNGYAGINSFKKKPSETYKKIAPHTIRSSNEKTVQSEPTLSPDEMDKRTEAASSVLKGSAANRRSYVMSAAKKYESSEKPDSSAEMGISFVAKRVDISDDDDTTASVKSVPVQSLSDTLISFSTEPASSDDDFDPIPISSEPTKSLEWYSPPKPDSSSTDTFSHFQHPVDLVADPINQDILCLSDSVPPDVLVSLAEDVIPIDTKSDWKKDMDSYKTITKTVESSVQENLPESEPKKNFVYVKEYVDNSCLDGSSSDYVSSTTSNYSYSSPSYYSR